MEQVGHKILHTFDKLDGAFNRRCNKVDGSETFYLYQEILFSGNMEFVKIDVKMINEIKCSFYCK